MKQGRGGHALCPDQPYVHPYPITSPEEVCAHLKGFLTFLWKYSFMPFLFCLGIKKGPLPVCLAVVFKLEGISGNLNAAVAA